MSDRAQRRNRGRTVEDVVTDLEGHEETLTALSDPDLMQQIRQSQPAVAKGDIVSLDDLRERLRSDPQA
jgi:hypothetical protein